MMLGNNLSNLSIRNEEDVTYQAGIDQVETEVITEIPAPSHPPCKQPIIQQGGQELVYFDVETTGFGDNAEIVQLAALKTDGKTYNSYIVPSVNFHPKASEVTGLTKDNDKLFWKGGELETTPVRSVINNFLDYLPDNAILVGHNVDFDCKHLMNLLSSCNMVNEYSTKVLGFCDTLPFFRKFKPGRKFYTQSSLVTDLLNTDPTNAHNAMDDVKYLKSLCDFAKGDLYPHTYTFDHAIQQRAWRKKVSRNVQSLQDLVSKKYFKKGMADKIGQSGLHLGHLRFAYEGNGITALFTEMHDGKPRITKNEGTIQSVEDYLKTLV